MAITNNDCDVHIEKGSPKGMEKKMAVHALEHQGPLTEVAGESTCYRIDVLRIVMCILQLVLENQYDQSTMYI